MSLVLTFLRLTKQVFLNVTVVLVLFFLPLDVLFRLRSWALFMPTMDIVTEVAMMVVVLSLGSISLAFLVAGAGCVLVQVAFLSTAARIEKKLAAVLAVGTLVILVILLLKLLKAWLQDISGATFSVGAAEFPILVLVIGFCVVWARKYGLLTVGNVIQSRLAKGSKVVLIFTVAAGIVVAVNGVALHDYREIKSNPIPLPRAGMPNVILLSMDTLTAEDMSLHGYRLHTTPNLEAFSKECYVFDNFFSSSNWTTTSVASFISGLYPDTSGVHHINGYFLKSDRNKNIGQALKENGYQTATIVANNYAHPLSLRISDSFSAVTEPPIPARRFNFIRTIGRSLYRLKGYGTYLWANDIEGSYFQKEKVLSLKKNVNDENSIFPPELVFERALLLLATQKQPNFIWAHVFPPHAPYLPAAPFKYRFGNFKAFSTVNDFSGYGGKYTPEQQIEVDQLRLRYDEFVLDTDSRLGDVLDKLKAMGRFDDSIIILTSDHGESFTKNHLFHNGPFLHQPLIHVPLMIHLPGQKIGKRIPFYAGHVDLLPTVMDLLDLSIPNWAEGESLKAAMLEGKPTSLPKFSMNLDRDSRFFSPSKGTIAVMQDGWKLVRYLETGREELYHLALDPMELTEFASGNPEQAKKMRTLIEARVNLSK